MTSRQQWAIVAGIVGVLAIGLTAASYLLKDDMYPVEQGSAAPDFRANVLGSATNRTFADYKGKVVLLNVWATWCKPCISEMPSLERLHQAYKDQGLKLVAVSIDDYVSEDSIRKFTRNLGVTFEVLHDSTHAIEKAYQVTGYPETFIIGPEGTIRRKWIGPDDWMSQGNRSLIAQLLGVQQPKPVVARGDTAAGAALQPPR